jgi:hypothetical protein
MFFYRIYICKVKKTIVYILLFFYVAVQLKPLTAVVQDVIAHTFFKMQHMTTVHYENGHYHLHAELETINKESNTTNKSNEKSSSQKTEVNSQQLLIQLRFNFRTNSSLIPTTLTSVLDLCSGFTRLNYLPPKNV